MLYLPYFMVFLLCIPLSSVAQTPCLSRLQHNSDEAIEEVQAWLRATPTTDKSDVLSIPVVIHIVWHESVENISDEQIYTQMEVLNDAFRAQLAEANNVLDIFRDLVTDTKITFCLAQRDPHAQATDGIVRIRVSDPAIVRDKAALFDASPLWNPRSYLNIYVVNLAESVDGEATFPSDATASDDAILINYRSFGTNGTALLNPSRDGGKSLVHEVGHYLGLRHIWGSQEGCTFDDFEGEDDTPLQSRSYLGRCPNGVQTSCGTPDMYMNFMDYTDDDCLAMFTPDQTAWMRGVLQTRRAGLLDSDGCEPPVMTVATERQNKSVNFWYDALGHSVRFSSANDQLQYSQVQLWTASGQIAAQTSGIWVKEWQWVLPPLFSGVYYLRLTDEQGRIFTKGISCVNTR